MNSVGIKLYDIARQDLHLSEERARAFVEAVDEVVVEDIRQSTSDYKSLFKEDFYKMDAKILGLETKIEQSKNDTVKWIFGVFLAVSLMIIGLYFKK